MNEAANKIRLMDRNFLPAMLVFTLPWLADIIIFAGTDEAAHMLDAPRLLLMNALYAAAPIFLTALAMRPRPRVNWALWGGAILTILLWAIYALRGRMNEINTTQDNGTAFIIMFIILMIWPCILPILMGIAAKFKEPPFETPPFETVNYE